jgi:hypothetical protein
MATAIWTTFAVGIMIGIFASCVIMVAVGIRFFENHRAKRRGKSPA